MELMAKKRDWGMTQLQRLVRVRQLAASGEARRIRQSANVSLNEIAEEVGVSLGAVWKWETGNARPTGQSALRYLRLLERLADMAEAAA